MFSYYSIWKINKQTLTFFTLQTHYSVVYAASLFPFSCPPTLQLAPHLLKLSLSVCRPTATCFADAFSAIVRSIAACPAIAWVRVLLLRECVFCYWLLLRILQPSVQTAKSPSPEVVTPPKLPRRFWICLCIRYVSTLTHIIVTLCQSLFFFVEEFTFPAFKLMY